ncbi:MAG: response regulator transcription factor [Anaerolineae bacterium]|nr:response regulator transcription factor [Anaerolineae bacterium]
MLPLTAHARECYLAWMMEVGAAGYLTKNEAPEALVAAIRRAAQGETCYTAEQVQRARNWREQFGGRWASLTAREREVLRLLARGLDNKGIAEALSVAPKTVESHVTHILDKLGVRTRGEAIAWAHTHLAELLLSPDDSGKSPM